MAKLDNLGRTIVSDVSLSVAPLGATKLGDRIMKYMRTPRFQEDMTNEYGYEGDYEDDLEAIQVDELEDSIHSDRYAERQRQMAANKKLAQEQKEKARKDKLIADAKDFSDRFKELKKLGVLDDAGDVQTITEPDHKGHQE